MWFYGHKNCKNQEILFQSHKIVIKFYYNHSGIKLLTDFRSMEAELFSWLVLHLRSTVIWSQQKPFTREQSMGAKNGVLDSY